MKKLALLLAVLMIVSLIPVGAVEIANVETAEPQGAVATLSAGTPIPSPTVDEQLGILMAYFNFDEYESAYDTKGNGWHYNYLPTYKDTNVKYAVVGTQYVYGLDNALVDISGTGLSGGIALIPAYEGESGLGGLFYFEGMPSGIQTMKFKILVPSLDGNGDENPDSTLRTYYNGDGDTIDWTPVADSTGANITRDTWKTYSRTTTSEIKKLEKWNFFSYKDNVTLIDDVEFWCYPTKSVLLKQAEDSSNIQFVMLTDTAFAFPTVSSVFPTVSGKTAWTDGTTVYETDDEIASEALYGKKFYPCEGTGSGEEEMKTVDEELGVLLAKFDFEGADFRAPSYAAYAVRMLGECSADALVGPADDTRFPSNNIDLALAGKDGVVSNFGFVKDSESELPEWPVGKQTIRLSVMVKSELDPGGSTRTFYNQNGEFAYSSDAPLAAGATSGANANRNTWRTYTRTAPAGTSAGWSFFCLTEGGTDYTRENVDDVEIWCYPDNGLILKNSQVGKKLQMATGDDNGKYTFPVPSTVFPTVPSDKEAWTNGVVTYAAGTEVDIAVVAGKAFYPCEADTPSLEYKPTPVPDKKVDDDLGELIAFFNFDDYNGSFIYPAYSAAGYSPSFGPGYSHSGDSWLKFGVFPGIESNALHVYPSGAYGRFQYTSVQGNHTIKFKIMVPKGADDSDMMTYYNNNGDYIQWTAVAESTGANADKGKWKDYSRTVTGAKVTAWHFFSQGEEILDDVELWVYPANGFILRPALGSDEGEMVKIDDGLDYTFPAVADKFASATGTVWTDGTNLFNAGDVVTASALHGKVIYVYDGGELSTYNPTPVPPQKMDKTMGELVAFFNFDSFKTGSTNKYPTFWQANIVLDSSTAADYIAPYGTVGTTDVVVSDAAAPALNGGSLKFVRTGTANPWPTGAQYIRFKIFVPADADDSTLKISFNGGTAVDVAAEANANKGTWQTITIPGTGTTGTSWEFTGGANEIIDDVEIWVFAEDAYIVEEEKDSDNFAVLHCAGDIFTFPSVTDVFPASTETKWTDGIQAFDEGDVVDASSIRGKTFYPGEDSIGKPKSEGNPEATDYRMTAAIRFQASVTSEQKAAMEKFGFLVSTEYLLGQCGTNILDHDAVKNGVKYYKEAIAFDASKQIIYKETSKKTTFSLVAYGIPDDKTDETLLVRAFMVVSGHTLYGTTVETTYDEVA